MASRSGHAHRQRVEALNAEVFRALLDQAGDAIQVTDGETLRFIYMNEAALRMHPPQ